MAQRPHLARIVHLAGDTVWLWADGQTWVEPRRVDSLLSVGQFVARQGEMWRAVSSAPAQPPHHDGDFARFSADGGRRMLALHARAVVLRAVRQFFDRRGFVEVDPPAVAASPGLELHLEAVAATLRQGMGGTHVQRWLVTSPEYHCKRLLSAGMTRIYAMQHAFRSGERGGWHNPEFMMLEWYRAGANYRDIVRDCRALFRHCAGAVARAGLPLAAQRAPYDPRQPWVTVSVRQALRRWAGFDPGRGDDDRLVARRAQDAGLEVRAGDTAADVMVRALVERVEPRLAELPGVVIDRWPASLASLARRFDAQPHLAERFEIYLQGIELANGFSELVDAVEQRQRFEADLAARRQLGRPLYPIDERFLQALGDGCPPAAGVALGVDRLVMALTGLSDISDVVAFPFEQA